MPRVMVEGFLKDYLEVDVVIGRELKEFHGYYTGFMEEEGKVREGFDLKELIKIEELKDIDIVGFSSSTVSLHIPLFSHCKKYTWWVRRTKEFGTLCPEKSIQDH
uniref:Glycerol-3-phosphate acyltransferase RAM2/GPAT1-8 HAD-like domain-containing protein n=1 Tax=Ananas comosus var. bracteatus TaxID=296719 RepID=A0A6V7NE55_ANACO|nr:unnamed protein product [Ananas comosus var. bracteatus]